MELCLFFLKKYSSRGTAIRLVLEKVSSHFYAIYGHFKGGRIRPPSPVRNCILEDPVTLRVKEILAPPSAYDVFSRNGAR